jgi:hypothetical protein
MLIRPIDKPLISLGEDHDNLVLLIVRDGLIVDDGLVELLLRQLVSADIQTPRRH